jgi:hypothetical protein
MPSVRREDCDREALGGVMNLARLYAEQICPVCGFKLDFQPWVNDVPTECPCPCCGTHFGYDDADKSKRERVYLEFRNRWIKDGRRWWSKPPAPPDYNPDQQLANLARLEKQLGYMCCISQPRICRPPSWRAFSCATNNPP